MHLGQKINDTNYVYICYVNINTVVHRIGIRTKLMYVKALHKLLMQSLHGI